jgi:CheY-like chemotaxis protein
MKILIVEDNKSQAQSLMLFLEYNGCECRIVEYQSKAIQYIQDRYLWKFDCAVVDIGLRDENDGLENKNIFGGIEVAKKLIEAKLPFIILSDYCPPQSPMWIKIKSQLVISNGNIYSKPTRSKIVLEHLRTIGNS